MNNQPQIDWDDVARKLKVSFDAMAEAAATNHYKSEKKPYCDSMAALADAMTRVSAEARAHREAHDKDNFKISKP